MKIFHFIHNSINYNLYIYWDSLLNIVILFDLVPAAWRVFTNLWNKMRVVSEGLFSFQRTDFLLHWRMATGMYFQVSKVSICDGDKGSVGFWTLQMTPFLFLILQNLKIFPLSENIHYGMWTSEELNELLLAFWECYFRIHV